MRVVKTLFGGGVILHPDNTQEADNLLDICRSMPGRATLKRYFISRLWGERNYYLTVPRPSVPRVLRILLAKEVDW
jgi:hypothetical protein